MPVRVAAPVLCSVRVCVALVVLTATFPNDSGPPVTLATAIAGTWYSTAPISAGLALVSGRVLPKKSVFGAPVLLPLSLAIDVAGIEYAPCIEPTAPAASICSGAVGVVAVGRLRVSGP